MGALANSVYIWLCGHCETIRGKKGFWIPTIVQARVNEYNVMKSNRSALGRKDKGSLAVRDLRGVLPADKVTVGTPNISHPFHCLLK